MVGIIKGARLPTDTGGVRHQGKRYLRGDVMTCPCPTEMSRGKNVAYQGMCCKGRLICDETDETDEAQNERNKYGD